MKKWIFILATLAMTLSGCMKASLDKGIDRKDWIIGTWYEAYDPTVFCLDGSSVVTLAKDGTALWMVHNILGGDGPHTIEYRYIYKNNIITVIDNGEFEFGTRAGDYEVIFLNKDEMAWQRVGTTYSVGTWSSDYLHFKRSTE